MNDVGVEILLQRRGRRWCIIIEEAGCNYALNNNLWTDSISWTVNQLEKNPAASRAAYHMWYFDSKLEAEKFCTFFWLTWA